MTTEVLYADGSTSTFHDGGAMHTGATAIVRLRLIMAISALEIYIKSNGAMELTRGGAAAAVKNVIEPLTGNKYKRSMNGKRDALTDARILKMEIEQGAVVWEEA